MLHLLTVIELCCYILDNAGRCLWHWNLQIIMTDCIMYINPFPNKLVLNMIHDRTFFFLRRAWVNGYGNRYTFNTLQATNYFKLCHSIYTNVSKYIYCFKIFLYLLAYLNWRPRTIITSLPASVTPLSSFPDSPLNLICSFCPSRFSFLSH